MHSISMNKVQMMLDHLWVQLHLRKALGVIL